MLRLERSDTLKSIYDLENPRRHKSVKQILNDAGAEPLNDNYEVEDHGNGYASIVPTESSQRTSTDE
jgi:hypothetical protein